MPRVGSREWNRQQNLRRQSVEEQVVQAQIVIQQVENVIVEAEPFECRRDIQNLREQIQNKINQIEQLKNNAKEMKRINKETLRLNKELMNKIKDYKDDIKQYEKDKKGVSGIIQEIYDNKWFCSIDDKRTIFLPIHTKLANANIIDKYLNPGEELTDNDYVDIKNYRKISSYIKWLEDTLLARKECVDYIKNTGGWLGYYTEGDDDITDKRLLEYTNNPLCKKLVEERIEKRNNKRCCVICDGKLTCQYGNNPRPVKTTGRCCDECNVKVVIPARFRLINQK